MRVAFFRNHLIIPHRVIGILHKVHNVPNSLVARQIKEEAVIARHGNARLFPSAPQMANVMTRQDLRDPEGRAGFCKRYLALLSARYGHNVKILYDIETSLLNHGVIMNLFQILIENYFVHGYNTSGKDNIIRFIGKSVGDNNMLLVMEDNGLGMSESEIAALNQKIGDPIQHNNESYGLKKREADS
jgi:hypothetical protein